MPAEVPLLTRLSLFWIIHDNVCWFCDWSWSPAHVVLTPRVSGLKLSSFIEICEDQALFWRISSGDLKWRKESGCNNQLRFRTSCWDLDKERLLVVAAPVESPFSSVLFLHTSYTRFPRFLHVQSINKSLIKLPFGLFFPAIKVLIKACAKDV